MDEQTEPPLSPTLKRKRGDSAGSNGEVIEQLVDELEHSESEEDDVSEIDLEDLVDSLATSAQPHELMTACTPAEVRARVREVGSSQFVSELLEQTGKTAQEVGLIFGLDADNINDPDLFTLLLEQIIVHSLQRRRKLKQYNTIDDAAELLKRSKNIMIITGAGISTSLGIPDFRSKHTGFYSKLQDMGFSEPEDVFDIHIFDDQPEIFYSLAGDILPKGKEYTPTHGFIRLIQDKEKLQTNYTQNIDNLEANAGLDTAKVIQCHGSFATATCRKCKYQVPGEEIFDDLRAKRVSYCKRCERELGSAEIIKPVAKKARSDFDDDDEDDDIPQPGVMKPDITFFGEQLPDTFFQRFSEQDAHTTHLVIVIGTSLKVAPVADIPNHLPEHVPHIYISREPCKHINFDIQLLGNCDTVCWELSKRAGWELKHEMLKELDTRIEAYEESDHLWRVAEVSAQSSADVEKDGEKD